MFEYVFILIMAQVLNRIVWKKKLKLLSGLTVVILRERLCNVCFLPIKFPHNPVLRQSTISRLLCRFEETGSVGTRKRSGRPESATNERTSTAVIF